MSEEFPDQVLLPICELKGLGVFLLISELVSQIGVCNTKTEEG
jgi:hypothetical protein